MVLQLQFDDASMVLLSMALTEQGLHFCGILVVFNCIYSHGTSTLFTIPMSWLVK